MRASLQSMAWSCYASIVCFVIIPLLAIILIYLRYGSIRIDAVHYCPLEQTLRHSRTKKNRRSKYVTRVDLDDDYVYDASTDPSQERMRLLADTLRSNYWLGSLVKYLKLPYTIRESLNSDLTRAAGACPNLRYVDLATGFFAGESRFEMLRNEIWINCPDIRTMKYTEGSERYFKALGDENRWNPDEPSIRMCRAGRMWAV